ncbi:CRISPR-associated helicase Cas3' [Thalassoroseus pseudoceratinae]|uniref:CRISPR-associated helicase Cas3' n=1 Tax=Thalassoroseus pseudoceratinae TaxID=2713176 RepID=UPI00141F86ED|nr:CRISPR-associated helicase Cas3' [Thalassoroseus pseudoceratinae]
MDPQRLWAKSQPYHWDDNDPRIHSLYLPQHLRDVYQAATQILDCSGEAQLRALGLDPELWNTRFRQVVLLAAAIHDLGKCGSHFQKMLKDRGRQAIRHEWVTLLIVDHPEWTQWLKPALSNQADWEIVRWAVAGHHPKYGRTAPPNPEDGPAAIRLPLDDSDFTKTVTWLKETFGLDGSPPQETRSVSLTFEPGNGFDQLAEHHYSAEDEFDDFSPDQRRFVAAVKNALIAADVAGSALPKDVPDTEERKNWVAGVLNSATLPNSEQYRRITFQTLHKKNSSCKLESIEESLREFQKQVGSSASRVTLVRAGCGTGKTIAAYWWAAHTCDSRRLFVCYPTTGTATEGFHDYLMDPKLAEIVKTDLVHGRRSVDFRILEADEDRNHVIARIASLDIWRTPVVACTVDTVLGVIQNNRRGLFSWPAIAQAGFVFDEIHSYDDKLFDALLHFLSALRGVPILLMTASLQAHRFEAIQKILQAGGEGLATISGPKSLETAPRYQWRDDIKLKDTKTVDALILEEHARGGKILYVCNTVTEALRTAERLEELSPIVYHSRFRYCDRVEQHRQVVEAFLREKKTPALAICTQVAEMSLDLSATLLVTAQAPVPSLIQRLGRLNRMENPERPRPFVIVESVGRDGKYSSLPYEEDDLKISQEWLETLGSKPISQRDLAEAWESLEMSRSSTEPPRWQSAWLDYGPATPVLELRDGSPTLTIVLEEDWPRLKDPQCAADLVEVAVPMPVRPGNDWQLQDSLGRPVEFNGVAVARSSSYQYDPHRGAQWL